MKTRSDVGLEMALARLESEKAHGDQEHYQEGERRGYEAALKMSYGELAKVATIAARLLLNPETAWWDTRIPERYDHLREEFSEEYGLGFAQDKFVEGWYRGLYRFWQKVEDALDEHTCDNCA